MTYYELTAQLKSIGVDDSESEALLLLSAFFGVSRSDTLLHPAREYDTKLLSAALSKRALGEPIQYIIGRVSFYNCELKVSPACLIPRPDTEILCEKVITLLPPRAHILELCTGSGCIPIAILMARADVTCESVELFADTVSLADENRLLNGISDERLSIIRGDALDYPVSEHISAFDAIVSNPPYIKSEVIPTLSREVLREPHAALDGGDDGMIFYRKFLSSYAPMLKPNGFFAFEIGYDQAAPISRLCESIGFTCRIYKDYGGNDRTAIIFPRVAK